MAMYSLALLGAVGMALPTLAAPSSTPVEVIDAVVGSGIDTTVSLVTTVVTTYFPYILAITIIVSFFVWLKRFATTGTK